MKWSLQSSISITIKNDIQTIHKWRVEKKNCVQENVTQKNYTKQIIRKARLFVNEALRAKEKWNSSHLHRPQTHLHTHTHTANENKINILSICYSLPHFIRHCQCATDTQFELPLSIIFQHNHNNKISIRQTTIKHIYICYCRRCCYCRWMWEHSTRYFFTPFLIFLASFVRFRTQKTE